MEDSSSSSEDEVEVSSNVITDSVGTTRKVHTVRSNSNPSTHQRNICNQDKQ
jgi:hypothetical protein